MAAVGQQLGPYTCVRRLGVGGMAETFLGVFRTDHGFEQRVCIKVMRDHLRAHEEFRRLFIREARLSALLRHANIVAVVDLVEDASALVLELVEGTDLRSILRTLPGRRLEFELVLWIAVELCKALQYAHGRTLHGNEHPIIHRDISPANVMISYAGEVKLADFGIAKALGDSDEAYSNVKGKVAYMAPEQAAGRAVDGRTDLYSLGVMLYELCCGKRPFDGESDLQTMQRALAGEYPPLAKVAPSLPAPFIAVIERLIRSEPSARFADAYQVLSALQAFRPPLTTFRSLGELAERARPHDTLATNLTFPQLRPAEGDVSRTLPLSEYAADRSPRAGAADGPVPAADDVQAASPSVVAGAHDLGSRTRARGGYARWLMLAGQGALFTFGGVALGMWLIHHGLLSERAVDSTETSSSLALRSDRASDEAPSNGQLLTAQRAADPVQANEGQADEGQADEGQADEGPASVRPQAQLPPAPSTGPATLPLEGRQPRAKASQFARTASRAAVPPPAAASAPSQAVEDGAGRSMGTPATTGYVSATLRVSVWPAGRVWVNRKLEGRAPVDVVLPAGLHVIGVGQEKPTLSRRLTIEGGKSRAVFFNLRSSSVVEDP